MLMSFTGNTSLLSNHQKGRRGNRGKQRRVRGRPRIGRPAEWRVPGGDDEQGDNGRDELEGPSKYAHRDVTSNASRYDTLEIAQDGQESDPEVDLARLGARQGSPGSHSSLPNAIQSDPLEQARDVDHTLSHLSTSIRTNHRDKPVTSVVEWDADMEALRRQKEKADSARELRERFQQGFANKSAAGSPPDESSLALLRKAVQRNVPIDDEAFLDALLD